jgi:Domain of unknown function (DUF4211)
VANVRFNGAKGRQPPKRQTNSIPTPEPSSQPQLEHPDHKWPANNLDEDDSEDDDIDSPTAKRRRISSNKPRQTTLTPRRSSRLQHQTPSNVRPSSSASSSSSQRLHSVEIPSPIPPRRTQLIRAEKADVQSSPSPRIHATLSDLGSPETSGDDDIITTKPAVQRRRSNKSPTAKDDFVVPDDGNIALSSEEDDASVTPSKRRKSSSTNQTPRSRRLRSRREHQELKDDLEDLQDENSPQLQSSRTRGAPVNKERERRREYIELLKRRRAGEKEPIQLDRDDEEEIEDIDHVANYTANAPALFFGRRKNTYSEKSTSGEDEVLENPELDADEDDFVVSDEEEAPLDLLGRPHPDIPLEFTSYASAKPRELFVFVIEWLVKNKIAPAFSRHDPLWKLAFSKIKDEVTAQAGSRLKSSAWTGSFVNALNARPGLTTTHLLSGDDFMHSCDACNRTNHPAQYDFVFSGSSYHHDSLDPVDPDSSSDADVEQDNASIDSKGHTLPQMDTHFYLGRYCAANAELAHKFTHWKYNLNDSLMEYLESQGVLSAEEIVRRERSKGGQRKREKEAEEIVDQMKATGVIDDLWKNFKADLDDARIGMEGHDKKGARGNKRIGSVRVAVSEVLRGVEDDEPDKPEEKDFGGNKMNHDMPETTNFGSDDEGE